MCDCNKPVTRTFGVNRNLGTSRQIVKFVPSPPQSPASLGMAPNINNNDSNIGDPINAERRRIESLKRKAAIQKHLGR